MTPRSGARDRRHNIVDAQIRSTFLDREQEIESLAGWLILGKARAGAITGPYGSGKTTLGLMFADHYLDSTHGTVLTAYGHEFPHKEASLLEQARAGQPPVLILIDEFNFVPNPDILLDRILHTDSDLRVLVLCQNEVPSKRLAFNMHLGGLSFPQARDLFAQVMGHTVQILDLDMWHQMLEGLKGNPGATIAAASTIRDGILTPDEVLESLNPVSWPGLVGPDGHPLRKGSASYEQIITDVVTVSEEFLLRLADDPKLLYELPPRKFEEVVAELLNRLGYEVELTPTSRDGGKDIHAAIKNEIGSFLYLVECKRYAPDRHIGVELVRQLYGVVQAERATAGMLATTSFFTGPAKEFQKRVQFQLSLHDFFSIQGWFRKMRK